MVKTYIYCSRILAEPSVTLKKGDFALLDFTAKIKENDQVFDTTFKDVAVKAGIFREDSPYEPVLIIVGEGWVVAGLDKELKKTEVGEKRVVELAPAEAFGPRDPSKVKIVSEREFLKRNVRPEPGQRLEVGEQMATVRSVNAGRVQLDFNHALSGKTLVYEFQPVKLLVEPLEKIIELAHRLAPRVGREKFVPVIQGAGVMFPVPEEMLYWDSLQSFKITLMRDIIKYLDNVEAVVFTEKFTYKLPTSAMGEVRAPAETPEVKKAENDQKATV